MNGETEARAEVDDGAEAPELAAVMAERDDYLDQLQRSRWPSSPTTGAAPSRSASRSRELANQRSARASCCRSWTTCSGRSQALPEDQAETPLGRRACS